MTSTTRAVRHLPLAMTHRRRGAPPATTDINPHMQLEQHAPVELQDALHEHTAALPGVVTGHSNISLPGARAYHLVGAGQPGDTGAAPHPTPVDRFMIGREFAHLHPSQDGSVHAALPPWTVGQVLANGWGELHPVAALYGMPLNVVMLYGPRDQDELDSVAELLELSRDYAAGLVVPPRSAWVVDAAHVC